MKDEIKRTVIGQDPHWWEWPAFSHEDLQIHHNPCYIDSMGLKKAEVSGEIDNGTEEEEKD